MSTVEKRHVFVFCCHQKQLHYPCPTTRFAKGVLLAFCDAQCLPKTSLSCSTQSRTGDTVPGARFKSPPRQQKKGTPQGDALFLAEKERSSSRFAASHCCRYRTTLRKRCFARVLRRLPLLSAPFTRPRRRSRTSLSTGSRCSVQIPTSTTEKGHPTRGCPFSGGEGEI